MSSIIKRLNINIIRPDINECFPDFYSHNNNFYYALGAIKNVGYESVSNIIKEREDNGKFKSISDFLKRVNPKDINKLQLEGLTKAGAFDSISNNRRAFYESIPNMILKSKNLFENKLQNQIELFADKDNFNNLGILVDLPEWSFQDKMLKEFETVGFYLSDHPLNQYKDIFTEYNIEKYSDFISNKNNSENMVAATILKIQEKKTQKGTPYAIIKFSDLGSIFELFVFSDIFELNRENIKEGKSVIITLFKEGVFQFAFSIVMEEVLKLTSSKSPEIESGIVTSAEKRGRVVKLNSTINEFPDSSVELSDFLLVETNAVELSGNTVNSIPTPSRS